MTFSFTATLFYGVCQNKVETNGITTAQNSTRVFPNSPTILNDLFLLIKAVIIPIIGSATAIINTDFENKSSLKNQVEYTTKEINKAAMDITPDFIIFISRSMIENAFTFTNITKI